MDSSTHSTGSETAARGSEQRQRSQPQELDQEKLRKERYEDGNWPNNIVSWDGPNDVDNPLNWSYKYRASITGLLGLTALGASFASSSFSPSFMAVAEEFHVSTEVTTLTLSLYVLGFAFGPLLFAPISELYGRKISYLPAYFIFGVFLIAVATAENIQTVMLCKYLLFHFTQLSFLREQVVSLLD